MCWTAAVVTAESPSASYCVDTSCVLWACSRCARASVLQRCLSPFLRLQLHDTHALTASVFHRACIAITLVRPSEDKKLWLDGGQWHYLKCTPPTPAPRHPQGTCPHRQEFLFVRLFPIAAASGSYNVNLAATLSCRQTD